MALKRPPELVRAHSKFVEIYEVVTQESEFRQTYQGVLGGLEPAWSLAREKKLVRVLMDLAAAGILPFEKFGVSEFVTPRPVCFRAIVTPSPQPVAKRLRAAATLSSNEPTTAPLPMSAPSAGSIPRPSWLKDLVGLHVESDLGKVALLELFALRASELGRHEHRGNPTEFDLVLWGFASQALKPCTFPSPLASLVNRDGLRARELGGLFDHLDRCVHLCFPHTAASRHRAEALEEVQKLKLDYIGMLNRRGYPRAALSLFRAERTLLD
jgi:hypothetical protein